VCVANANVGEAALR